MVPYPYDPVKREQAEEKQLANLKEVKRTRDNREVARLLRELEQKAKKEEENLIPHFIECAKAYVTEQEVCDVLREIFGEWQPVSI
jgi:methylmalonyl-CoA mutase N-terminal domain/subunit